VTDIKLPTKTINPESDSFWKSLEDEWPNMQQCQSCEKWQHYPRVICSHCWSLNLIFRPISGLGHVLSLTDVFKPGHPAFSSSTPYRLLIVQLLEGPKVLSRQSGEQPLAIEDQVEAEITSNENGYLLCFRKKQ
jgi:hypothetical protein